MSILARLTPAIFVAMVPGLVEATSIECQDTPQQKFAYSERVFVGKLTGIEPTEVLYSMDRPARLTFEVRRNYKGEGHVVILEARLGYEKGREYLIFARRHGDALFAGSCDILPTAAANTSRPDPKTKERIDALEVLVGDDALKRLNGTSSESGAPKIEPGDPDATR